MEFPIVIEDITEMKQLVRLIARETAQELLSEPATKKGKPFMTKQDCYREAGSREMVDRAIRHGTLRVNTKEGMRGILRTEFQEWLKTVAHVSRKKVTCVSIK